MLNRDYESRISIRKCLEHKWIKDKCGHIRVSRKKATAILNNLNNYKPLNKFQHATWVLLVS